MSRTHDGHHASSPFGNPFKLVFSKGPNRSSKLLTLLNSFEQSLAEDIRKLKPNDTSKFHSFIWLRQAVDALVESHNKFKSLIIDLEFPASVWDEKWIELYLNDSLNLLDVCIALISEVSRLEQHQVLLRYALQILNSCSSHPSPEQLQRAGEALHDWIQKLDSRSSKLENAPSILQGMLGTLSLPKVKNSPKGRVLMRALYAVKIVMMFIASVLLALFSGSSKPLMDMQVPNDFSWAMAFNDLQLVVNKELKGRLLLDKPVILNELGEVHGFARSLNAVMVTITQKKDEKEIARNNDVEEVKRRCEELILELSKSSARLSHELELLGKKLNDFFELIMSGRDGLLGSLRTSEEGRKLKY
ncbi:UPF0496 protein 4-like [Phalaenopsis equestris]|uniref:UPF0496 protein 4-like n=1 Tax=Phalaenopsis equestris TaxID=78828 RepID=UPI0009E1B508|nr:UPF0496 protein 4-like [Phalaenopsis equestris]XP_020599549.1 UPF0496 protein 4-like [Phalaenopsis equestris]